MKKRILTFLMVLVICLSLFPTTWAVDARDRLNIYEREIYDRLVANIAAVAAGTVSSTEFTIDLSTFSTDFTTYYNTTTVAAQAAFVDKYDFKLLLDALLHDCPYDLYWYDKTVGTQTRYSMSASGSSEDGTYAKVTFKQLSFKFTVAKNYRADLSNPYAVANAQSVYDAAIAIVNANVGKNDYEKLIAYRDAICASVSYNTNAATSNNFSQNIDPWQLIYVFDNNPSTNVVCEGYAKAFKYLCDLSSFTRPVECYLVSGNMSGGTGAGAHMWNIVTIGDSNYLVDVTNSDANSIGAAAAGEPSPLFLVGGKQTPSSPEYSIPANGTSLTFTYDEETLKLWGYEEHSILMLAEENYTYDDTDPLLPAITTATRESTGVRVSTESNAAFENASLLVAVYDEYGKMLAVNRMNYQSGAQTIGIICDPAKAKSVKVFLMDDKQNPLRIASETSVRP